MHPVDDAASGAARSSDAGGSPGAGSPSDKGGAPKGEGKPRRRPSRGPRTPMPERTPAERPMTFAEVGLGYSPEQALAEAQRCLQCKDPTCSQGCPVNIDIRGFIGAIIEGDLAAGISMLKARNALPAVCGRVCPQEEQCEALCVLAKKRDPVAIGRLERFLGDIDLACELDNRCVPEVAPASGFRCAVVGSGPAGLACAGELAQLGHAVTILCLIGSDFTINCDTVISAVGTRANPLLKPAAPGLGLSRHGYITTDDDGAANLPGVFAGGDIVTGSATVILAMGAGKKAARAMDRWLRGPGSG